VFIENNVKYLHNFKGLPVCVLTGLHQKKHDAHESSGQEEDYATISAPYTRAYQQVEMTQTRPT